MAANLSEADVAKVVSKTKGYSGSDMRNLIQEACQGPVRDAVAAAANCSALQQMSESDLRPVIIRDFQVGLKQLVHGEFVQIGLLSSHQHMQRGSWL